MATAATATRGPARASWWPDLIFATAAFSVLVVVALWVHGRGLQDLTGPAAGFTSVGRLTGLVSADLLLLQVLLMARLPSVERAYGRDALTRWHRWLGFTSFDLMLAHVVLITIGYALISHSNVFGEFWSLITTYPGMLLALAATVALCLVAFTSVRLARRRLRYESWHLLHLYAYLGVGLAIPHELWTGAQFLDSGWATVYWWTLYLVAAGAILVFRVGLPLWRSLRYRLRVERVVTEGPGVWSIWLTGRALDRLPVRAGQFFNWRFLTGSDWSRAHPYSLSAAPGGGRLRITVKAAGDDSGLVGHLRPGTRVLIEGPYGGLTGERRTRNRLTMVASGIGVTPLRALLEELPYRRGHATLIYRARTDNDFTFRTELDRLAAARGVRVYLLPGPRAAADAWAPAGYGEDAELLRRLVPDLARHDVYVCGPDGWMEAVLRAARTLGVPAANLHTERFTW